MWPMLRVQVVGGKFLKAVHSFYVDYNCMACVVRLEMDVSQWFLVYVGLR